MKIQVKMRMKIIVSIEEVEVSLYIMKNYNN